MSQVSHKRKRGQTEHKHPYLTGNFAPIDQTSSLTPCTFEGRIPEELIGGEYIRNGGNPVSNEDLGRDAHWFDGDGMLSGVSFRRDHSGNIIPEFVNQFVLTDVYLSSLSTKNLKTPVLPSIATLVNPAATLITITLRIFRTILLVILSFLPGSKQAIKKISVANTSIYYHDGRALAGCESGPPMRISLPGLETVGWYNGSNAEGEGEETSGDGQKLGGEGLLGWIREWTTAHPKVDPQTKEMMLFHSSFAPPYVQYSVIPEAGSVPTTSEKNELSPYKKLLNMPLPGVASAKMMHDFGVSPTHSVIMDLPLSLDPLNLAKGRAVVEYDAMKPSRFGVFPRHQPDLVRWFETAACCIFHTANTWDEVDQSGAIKSIHMLACRLTSSSLVFSAGNVAAPQPTARTVKKVKKTMPPFFSKYTPNYPVPTPSEKQIDSYFDIASHEQADDLESATPLTRDSIVRVKSYEDREPLLEEDEDDFTDAEEDQCRLYHYNFSLTSGAITSQYAIAAIAFEFPSVHPSREMQNARYIYGCTTSSSSFGAALGRSVKIDVLVKADVQQLIAKGEDLTARGLLQPVTGCVDRRPLSEIIRSTDAADPLKAFVMPAGWYAQEPRFVPRNDAVAEDDGYLLFYAFDEAQLNAEGEVPSDADAERRAKSELWIVDAADMSTVVGKVKLPQRVPYGLHGTWFPAEQIQKQRAVESMRSTDGVLEKREAEDEGLWMALRGGVERWLA
ncbi:hypothetical protein MBLNU457_4160t1 [Dothideomycetes sp. NU457]